MTENTSNELDRFGDIVKTVEETLLVRSMAYSPVRKCVDDVNGRISAYSLRFRFIISVIGAGNEEYLVIDPKFVGADRSQIIVDLDSNNNYVIKSEEVIINVTKDGLRKTLLDCMYKTIEDYIDEIASKKTTKNIMEEDTSHISMYLEKFKDAMKVAEVKCEFIEKLYKEVDDWVSDVNYVLSQYKPKNFKFHAELFSDHVSIGAEFGQYECINVYCLDNDRYKIVMDIWERLDLTKDDFQQEVLSGMLRMLTNTLAINLE